jgi:hypothetical protein
MEAIAHSPSFAKKVHIPQSVGKDFAAADKGKTFKRGGDMKGYADGGMPMVNKGGKMVPSFAADGIGKMAKGGMASKMKMFEKSGKDIEKKGMKEGSKADMALDKKQMMKAGGKVRRMAVGGAVDYLDSLENEDYAKQKEQGAKNLKSLKSFFGFGEQEPAPIDRSRDVVSKPTEGATYKPRPPLGITKTQSPRTSSGNSAAEDEVERSDAAMMAASRDKTAKGPQYTSNVNQGETDFDYESQRGTKTGSGASGFPSGYKDSGFSAVTKPPVKRKPIGIEKTEKKERVITEPVDTSYSALEARRAAKKLEETKPESKSARKFGMASDETRASVRKGLGSFLDFFDLSKAHEREFGKKAAKGGSVKRMRYGGSPEDGMDMGQPMRGMAPTPAPRAPVPRGQGMMNPNSIAALQAAYGNRGPSGGNDMNVPMDPRMKAGGSVKKMAEGGFTREADGVAKKGKTQGKLVKMASGGFVKTADGCAQRGKTKAFQVKMNRGGMC